MDRQTVRDGQTDTANHFIMEIGELKNELK